MESDPFDLDPSDPVGELGDLDTPLEDLPAEEPVPVEAPQPEPVDGPDWPYSDDPKEPGVPNDDGPKEPRPFPTVPEHPTGPDGPDGDGGDGGGRGDDGEHGRTDSGPSGPDRGAHEPVDLSLDDEALSPASSDPDGAAPGSTDGGPFDDGGDGLDGDATDDSQRSDGTIELPLDDPASELDRYDVPAGNGVLDDAVLAAALSTIGVAVAVPALSRLTKPSGPDTVALLDSLGVDARVEHGDLYSLSERLDAGDHVMLASDGSAGLEADRVMHVRTIDRDRGVLQVVDAARRSRTIDLERFEDAWADTANQLVVAAGPEGRAVLLPVALRDTDLSPV